MSLRACNDLLLASLRHEVLSRQRARLLRERVVVLASPPPRLPLAPVFGASRLFGVVLVPTLEPAAHPASQCVFLRTRAKVLAKLTPAKR